MPNHHFAFTEHSGLKGGSKSACFASHKRTNIARFHLYEVLRVVKFTETDNRMIVARREKGMGSKCLYVASVEEDEKVLDTDGDSCTTM